MNVAEPTQTTNLDIYGNDTLPWSRVLEALAAVEATENLTWFLGTVDPDGRPHAAGVGGFYLEGDVYFTSGARTRKSRDLALNPACTVSVRLSGIDMVFEGEAIRATDHETLAKVVELANKGGWPAEIDGEALTAPFSAPSAGPPPWQLYRLNFTKVFGVATAEPYGASRWRFER